MQSAGAAEDRGGALERVAFFVAVFAQAIPMAMLRHFPSEDGPGHIGSGEIIANHTGALDHYFDIDFRTPNASGFLLTAGLMELTSPVTSSRVVVLLCVLSIPLAARYAFTAFGDTGRWLSWLTLPLAIGWYIHHGVWNFCLGTALLLFMLGYWWRHEGQGRRATATLAVLLLALLLTHIIPFVVGVVILFARATWQLLERRQGQRSTFVDVSIAAVVPVVLFGTYTLTEVEDASVRQTLRDLIVNLITLQQAVMAYDRLEKVAGLLVVAAVGVLVLIAVLRAMPRTWRDPSIGLLAAVGVVVGLYLVLPDGTTRGGGDVTARLVVLVYLTILAWLAQYVLPRRALVLAAVAGLAASMLLTAVRVPRYVEFEDEISEFLSIAPHIERHSTVVPVNLAQASDEATDLTTTDRVRPTLALTGWLMAERQVVDLSHFEAWYEVNPPLFHSEVDPFDTIGQGPQWIDQSPPVVDLLRYEAETGGAGQIDYVLVFGRVAASDHVLEHPHTAALDMQLEEAYELVATSSPDGLVELYRRTG